MTIIKDWEQVPRFTGDREEAVFWEDAQVDVRLMEASVVAGNTANESVTASALSIGRCVATSCPQRSALALHHCSESA